MKEGRKEGLKGRRLTETKCSKQGNDLKEGSKSRKDRRVKRWLRHRE